MQIKWSLKRFNELSPEELYQILNLRIEVFMIEQRCLYKETDYHDQQALHLYASSNDGALLAYARILPPNSIYYGTITPHARIGRVVVEKTARGTGLSYQLMEQAIITLQELYNTEIEISAQAHLNNFYQRFGFVSISEEYLEDNIPHIRMRRYPE